MPMPAVTRMLLCISFLLSLILSSQAQAAFDPKKLETRVDIKLTDASMADAVAMLAKVGGIDVAAPAEPTSGLTADLSGQTVRAVVQTLAKMTGLTWHIEGNVIVFRRPVQVPTYEPTEESFEKLTLEEAMTEILRTLSDLQLFRLSLGFPLTYTDLSPYQQQVLKAMLSSARGITPTGEILRQLPAPEQLSVSFYVMPYFQIPGTDSTKTLTIRMDSTPYIYLRKIGGQ